MRRLLSGILFAIAVMIAVSCGPRIIPADKLSLIYRDMFLADQWIQENPDMRNKADSTLFYDPIFKKYGYRFKNYDATVKYYLNDYDKFIRIVRAAADMLKEEAEKEQAIQDWIDSHPEISVNYVLKDFVSDDRMWEDSTTFWPVRDTSKDTALVSTRVHGMMTDHMAMPLDTNAVMLIDKE